LIHDDLPALDNDDFRRGQPTNHKKFGEATAILAGDALLTEAYGCLQDIRLDKTSALISLLTEAAGLRGMVAGQAMDIDFPSSLGVNSNYLVQIHKLKTASLIRAACEGSALIVLSREQQALRAYGEHLGLSFQIADDILDKDEGEKQNLVSMIGPCGTQDLLEYHIDQAIKVAQNLPRPEFLVQLALFNLYRKK
jgi:geranylgeranyl diphosphate synthase type II